MTLLASNREAFNGSLHRHDDIQPGCLRRGLRLARRNRESGSENETFRSLIYFLDSSPVPVPFVPEAHPLRWLIPIADSSEGHNGCTILLLPPTGGCS